MEQMHQEIQELDQEEDEAWANYHLEQMQWEMQETQQNEGAIQHASQRQHGQEIQYASDLTLRPPCRR